MIPLNCFTPSVLLCSLQYLSQSTLDYDSACRLLLHRHSLSANLSSAMSEYHKAQLSTTLPLPVAGGFDAVSPSVAAVMHAVFDANNSTIADNEATIVAMIRAFPRTDESEAGYMKDTESWRLRTGKLSESKPAAVDRNWWKGRTPWDNAAKRAIAAGVRSEVLDASRSKRFASVEPPSRATRRQSADASELRAPTRSTSPDPHASRRRASLSPPSRASGVPSPTRVSSAMKALQAATERYRTLSKAGLHEHVERVDELASAVASQKADAKSQQKRQSREMIARQRDAVASGIVLSSTLSSPTAASSVFTSGGKSGV